MIDTATHNHVARILSRLGPEMPADLALRRYLAESRQLGPRERRSISRAMFSYFRWWRWLNERDSLQKQVEQAIALSEQFIRQPHSVKAETMAVRAVPDWLRDEMELSPDFLRQLQREPTLWLRARPGTGAKLAAELKDCAPTPLAPDALRFTGVQDLFLTPQFQSGAFEIQDLASQCVGHAAAPLPGQTWWDACAGEGGKTLHLADLMQNRGLVWASDRSVRRLAVLKQRAARAKLYNYRTAPWDGIKLPTKTKFDGVLLDAPCSGVGTWRRNPHARWTVTPDDVRELAGIQTSLLATVAGSVKPGGRLIYAVCTLTRSETIPVAGAFSAAHAEFEPIAESTRFLWPQNWMPTGCSLRFGDVESELVPSGFDRRGSRSGTSVAS